MEERRIGSKVIVLDSVNSTNKYAADRISTGELAHGTVIMAHEQTDGAGQRGSSWHTSSGQDLALSVVIRPDSMKVDQQFVLNKLVALSVRDAVVKYCQQGVTIKWPNDILVGDKKIAGILIQNELSGDRLSSVIVGVGMNVNSTAIPHEFKATSLRLDQGHEFDLKQVLSTLCGALEARYSHWVGGQVAWLDEYTDHLWALGRWAEMRLDGKEIVARPLNVDDQGCLVVELKGGEVKAFGSSRLGLERR